MFNESLGTRTYSQRSLHGRVAHFLGSRIVSGEIAEGTQLSTEEHASADLEVSRTAYREAIKVLAAKGLVESRPKVGTRVRPRREWNMLDPDVLLWASDPSVHPEFYTHLFEFRLVFEPAAARMAAQKADRAMILGIRQAMAEMAAAEPGTREHVDADLAFHVAILQATGNEFLIALCPVIATLLARSFEVSSRRPQVRAASVPLHQAVCDHIIAGNAAGAAEAMTRLLDSAQADIGVIMREEFAPEPARASRE